MGCQNCILRVQRHFLRNCFHRIILIGTVRGKNSAGFVKTAFYFSRELLSKTVLEVVVWVFLLVLARFFKHGLPKLYSTSPEALFAEFFFSQKHNIRHCERKKSAGFLRTAFFFFRGIVEQNTSRIRRFGVFSSPCQIFQAWVAKTVFYVSRGTFRGFFFNRNILIGTVSGKIQLVLSELHSTFPGNFWAKHISFTSPCQIFQAWVAKTVFYVSRGTFCGTFFTESYYLALWAKKFSWFCENSILFFRGTFEQINSRSLDLDRFFMHGLPKLCSTCPEALFAELFSQNHRIGTVSEKIQLVLPKLLSTFPGSFWAKQFSKSSFGYFF